MGAVFVEHLQLASSSLSQFGQIKELPFCSVHSNVPIFFTGNAPGRINPFLPASTVVKIPHI